MSSGYFSRHGDTIHCGQQWLQTGTRGWGGYKESHSERGSISSALHACRGEEEEEGKKGEENTHTLRPGEVVQLIKCGGSWQSAGATDRSCLHQPVFLAATLSLPRGSGSVVLERELYSALNFFLKVNKIIHIYMEGCKIYIYFFLQIKIFSLHFILIFLQTAWTIFHSIRITLWIKGSAISTICELSPLNKMKYLP